MKDGWIQAADWERVQTHTQGAACVGRPCVHVLIADPELGTIAVARSADGREAYGADSPRR
jgi:hypothetical protein